MNQHAKPISKIPTRFVWLTATLLFGTVGLQADESAGPASAGGSAGG
jgi:hypothetical protein